MIELNNIHKSFNDKEVIKGVNLTVEKEKSSHLLGALVLVKQHY